MYFIIPIIHLILIEFHILRISTCVYTSNSINLRMYMVNYVISVSIDKYLRCLYEFDIMNLF